MADAEAARAARESAVGDQRHLVSDVETVERRRGRQHLAHARATLGSLVADDENFAVLELAFDDRVERRLLGIETARRTGEGQVLTLHARYLHDGTVARQVALQS